MTSGFIEGSCPRRGRKEEEAEDGEEVRDHLLRAIYGSFSNAKKDAGNANYRLTWISYLLGKRESRRLVGDHVFTFEDVINHTPFPDSVVMETRESRKSF